jgi:scyllo-inositol 2-dehydrogenase (NADP+)
MTKIISVGIIGFGRMGITHFSIINSHPNVEIKAVADSSSTILGLLKKYVKEINTYKNYKELFETELIDAVLICTPPSFHYPIAIEAAQKNIHVFIEKPCTINKESALELSELFEEKHLVNQVGYVNRYNDVFQTVKRFIDNRVIGQLIRFKSEMYSCTITKSAEGKSWRDSHVSGGGATFDMAAHAIDLVNYLVGKPDKVIGSSLTKIFSRNVEDAVSATFLYANGITGTLNVNWSDSSFRKPTNKIELFGSDGKILADQHGIKVFKNSPSISFNMISGWNTIYITDVFKSVPFYVRGNEFTSQLYQFVDSILDREKSNICTIRNSAETLEVIEEIFSDYQSSGKNI